MLFFCFIETSEVFFASIRIKTLYKEGINHGTFFNHPIRLPEPCISVLSSDFWGTDNSRR